MQAFGDDCLPISVLCHLAGWASRATWKLEHMLRVLSFLTEMELGAMMRICLLVLGVLNGLIVSKDSSLLKKPRILEQTWQDCSRLNWCTVVHISACLFLFPFHFLGIGSLKF